MSGRVQHSKLRWLPGSLANLVWKREKDEGARNQLDGFSEGEQWKRAMAEAARFSIRLIGGLISLAFLWIIIGKFVVPAVIESAYRGESLPFINDIISGQAIHPVEHYLASWEASWEMISWRVLPMLVVVGLIPLPLMATQPELQIYLETRYGNAFALKPLPTNTILALFGLTLVLYLYFFDPVSYVSFIIAEDSWAEYGSFVSWAMASCFFAWILFKDRGFRKPGLMLLAFGAFFVATEEISWGQRILDLQSPTLFAEYNLQGETNLHNLVAVTQGRYMIAGIAIFLWSILLPLLATKWGRLWGWCNRLGIPIVPMHLWPLFLLAISFLIYHPVLRSDEVSELFLAIAIVALSLDLVLTARRGTRPRGSPAITATAGMLLTLGILTVFLVQFYSSPEKLGNKLNIFAVSSFPNAGMYRQAEMVFDYINQHPQFLTPETHFRHGALLVQLGKHSKGRKILEVALADQKRLQQEWPESPTPYRIAGQVLALLERQQEAEVAFLQAIEKDLALLERATDAGAEARVRWSLAKTLLASGDSEAASEQLSIARAVASDRKTKGYMDRWIRGNFQ
ncbi:MAG: tetratricopeptide repeat protein [Candidatus Binatia bacterium]